MWATTSRLVRAVASREASHLVNQQRTAGVGLLQGSRLQYSTTSPISKIIHVGDKGMTQEEMEKMMEEEEAAMIAAEKAKEYPDWVPGQRKKPLIKAYDLETFERELIPEKYANDPLWTLRDKRCGALAIKVGMMPVWDNWGVRHGCTVLWLDRNIVIGHKTMDSHGYMSIRVAAGERKAKNVGKCIAGQYQSVDALDGSPPYLVKEFRVTDEEHLLPIGSQLHARHFVPGQNLDVAGITKGKGFQGGMKRHGFAGMPASHGTSLSHRALGSTGQCQDPGKVFKGKKMAGHMGTDRVTKQNLKVIKVDRGMNLIYVAGGVPGNKGEFVELRDAIKKPLWRTDEVLGSLKRPPLPTFEYDLDIDGSGQSGHEEYMPLGKDDPLDPDYMDSTVVIKAQA